MTSSPTDFFPSSSGRSTGRPTKTERILMDRSFSAVDALNVVQRMLDRDDLVTDVPQMRHSEAAARTFAYLHIGDGLHAIAEALTSRDRSYRSTDGDGLVPVDGES